jgi:NAD(P)-dependent dehydrogenase (short-subunit alcohol dehydrogenase family)
VVGASRGLGRGIAESFSAAGASVLAIARDAVALDAFRAADASIEVAVGDAADPGLAFSVVDSRNPDILAVVAGASPPLRPIHEHTWETFSQNWNVDVQLTFNWLREALVKPLRPGSRVLLMSSGAAAAGSPLSGGYAGAKATIRFVSSYAAAESDRSGLRIRFVSVLPQLTPATELGAAAVAAYAAREGMTVPDFLATRGPALTTEQAGQAVLDLAADPSGEPGAYLLTAGGLTEIR